MSQEDGLSNGEFEMSVAAAAFAIVSLEEGDGDKAKGGKEENRIRTTNRGTNSGSFFWWFFKDDAKDTDKLAGDKGTTKSQTTAQHDSTVDRKKPETIMNTTSSIRRTTTFSDKNTGDINNSMRNGNGKKKTRFSSFKMSR